MIALLSWWMDRRNIQKKFFLRSVISAIVVFTNLENDHRLPVFTLGWDFKVWVPFLGTKLDFKNLALL